MTAYLRVEADDGRGTAYTLIDATNPALTQVRILEGADWGNAVWEQQTGGARGTQGARAPGRTIQNRRVSLPFRVYGSSKDNLAAVLSGLGAAWEQVRRHSGRIVWRSAGQTWRQYLDVMGTPGLAVTRWGDLGEVLNAAEVTLAAECAPYAQGDPMDTDDEFLLDRITAGGIAQDWTFDAGAQADVAVTGGVLAITANPTVEHRFLHTAKGYTFADAEVTMLFRVGTPLTDTFKAGALLRWVDSTTYISVFARDSGGTSSIRVEAANGGAPVNQASTNVTRLVAGQWYGLRARLDGNTVRGELYTNVNDLENPLATPANTVIITLPVPTYQLRVGRQSMGKTGIVWAPQVTSTAQIRRWRSRPFTYLLSAPDEVMLNGAIPGDAPALVEVQEGTSARWLALGWYRRPAVHNLLWNGSMEDGALAATPPGWSVAANGTLCGAATSFVRDSGAYRSGPPTANAVGASGLMTAIAGNNESGAWTTLTRPLKAGITYFAIAWVYSAASVQNVALRIGATSSLHTTPDTALAASWKPMCVLFQPIADIPRANVAVVRRTAALADVFRVDGVCVCEARPAYFSASPGSAATSMSVRRVPEDWPDPNVEPFLAVIPSSAALPEVVLVTGRSGSTLTVIRAQEGTAAVNCATDEPILPLPSKPQFDGFGALPPFGVWDAAGQWLGAGLAATANANSHSGTIAQTSGTVTTGVTGMVDTSLVDPDEGVDDEVSALLITRLLLSGGNPKFTLSAWSAAQLDSASGVYGPLTYPIEFGSAYHGLHDPSSNSVFEPAKVGTLRWRRGRIRNAVTVSLQGASIAQPVGQDFTVSLPAARCALHPTGVAYAVGIAGANSMFTIKPDLSATFRYPPQTDVLPHPGLGGALLEFPPGPVNVIVAGLAMAPDTPAVDGAGTGDGSTGSYSTHVHFAVTPRYAVLRS